MSDLMKFAQQEAQKRQFKKVLGLPASPGMNKICERLGWKLLRAFKFTYTNENQMIVEE